MSSIYMQQTDSKPYLNARQSESAPIAGKTRGFSVLACLLTTSSLLALLLELGSDGLLGSLRE